MSAQAKYQAEDKEKLERGAKNCWNRMTRFLDKTSEILYMISVFIASFNVIIYYLFIYLIT